MLTAMLSQTGIYYPPAVCGGTKSKIRLINFYKKLYFYPFYLKEKKDEIQKSEF